MRTIEVSEETYEKIKEQLGEDEITDLDSMNDLIGGKWFFRTVTYHLLGKVTKIIGKFVKLEEASWIANSGRFTQFIKNGEVDEVEPVGTCFVNMDTVVDFYEWIHPLLKDQK